MTEIWKPIPGYGDAYEASSLGRIRSVSRRLWFTSKRGGRHQRVTQPRIMAAKLVNSGYFVVGLSVSNSMFYRTVHSLVAAAFIGPRPEGYEIAHGDGDRSNNTPTNLRYATRKENHADKKLHGTQARGSQIRQSKLTESDVPRVRARRGVKSADETAAEFGVTRRTISRLWRGESWAHV